jgi:hypothetical protein
MTWATVRRWFWSDKVLWTTPHVARVFMICDKCRQIVPSWRLVGLKLQKSGCRCGCSKTWAMQIPEWKAAYWLLIRGWLIRKVLLRKTTNWDPRLPLRDGDIPS